MIDLPIGKAIVAVEAEIPPEFGEEAKACRGCVFSNGNCNVLNYLPCWPDKRKDGKNVIFKIVDIVDHKENP